MKVLKKRKNFKNRHLDSLPKKEVNMKVIINNYEGEHIMLCRWEPFNKNNYNNNNMPAKGYLGTAIVIEKQYYGIGFNVWEQNNSEFIYYSVVN